MILGIVQNLVAPSSVLRLLRGPSTGCQLAVQLMPTIPCQLSDSLRDDLTHLN
jgi:hypothetical protein